MEDLGWNVELQSHTDRNNVLKRPIQFNNIIATLDKNVSIFVLINKQLETKQQQNFILKNYFYIEFI